MQRRSSDWQSPSAWPVSGTRGLARAGLNFTASQSTRILPQVGAPSTVLLFGPGDYLGTSCRLSPGDQNRQDPYQAAGRPPGAQARLNLVARSKPPGDRAGLPGSQAAPQSALQASELHQHGADGRCLGLQAARLHSATAQLQADPRHARDGHGPTGLRAADPQAIAGRRCRRLSSPAGRHLRPGRPLLGSTRKALLTEALDDHFQELPGSDHREQLRNTVSTVVAIGYEVTLLNNLTTSHRRGQNGCRRRGPEARSERKLRPRSMRLGCRNSLTVDRRRLQQVGNRAGTRLDVCNST